MIRILLLALFATLNVLSFNLQRSKGHLSVSLTKLGVSELPVLPSEQKSSHPTPSPTIKPSVWSVFNEVAKETGAINLGQGFPDWKPAKFLLNSLREVTESEYHQYTRPAGHLPLVSLLAMRYGKHLDRYVDPLNEVAITVGASQALFLSLMTLLRPGDEVLLFEPFFDLYLKQIALTGATPKFVSLGSHGSSEENPWSLDLDELEAKITPKTKVLILNSPHNPTGKVFSLAELSALADIMRRYPHITVISDEVYKYTVYNPIEEGDSTSRGHYHFARLPGMFDRTITLSSCGKTFSVTGWQVGWAVPFSLLLSHVSFIHCSAYNHRLDPRNISPQYMTCSQLCNSAPPRQFNMR